MPGEELQGMEKREKEKGRNCILRQLYMRTKKGIRFHYIQLRRTTSTCSWFSYILYYIEHTTEHVECEKIEIELTLCRLTLALDCKWVERNISTRWLLH
jgi:hypothetical protein